MKVMICGAGKVGTSIARQLAKEGNDVTVIDQSEELIRHLSDTLDVKAIHGFGSHPDVLELAGGQDTDLLIAVTVSDEVNMVACQIAHSIFNIPTKIARIRSQHYLHPLWHDLYRKDHLPIDVIISPEIEVAHAIVRRLHAPGAVDMVPFAGGAVQMVAVRSLLDCPMLGLSLADIEQRMNAMDATIAGIVRDNDFLLPHKIKTLRANDDVYFLAEGKDVRPMMQLLGHEEKEAQKIVIIGGGNIGTYLAQALEADEHSYKVRIIERDYEQAEKIADTLRRTTVICGNAMDRAILQEAHVDRAETVIAVTNDDKVNILSTLLAKREGCERSIALVNNMGYNNMVMSLGVDAILSPRETTVSTILQHVRRGKIHELHSVRDGIAEFIEAEVLDGAPLAGISIADADLPRGIRIAAIVRDGSMIRAEEDTIIQPKDHVISVTMANMVKKVEKLFASTY